MATSRIANGPNRPRRDRFPSCAAPVRETAPTHAAQQLHQRPGGSRRTGHGAGHRYAGGIACRRKVGRRSRWAQSDLSGLSERGGRCAGRAAAGTARLFGTLYAEG
uniref:(northern house mosquito) hypothetical protein n=1 Tax=Culex pipiens TaxID=7175 RepID=A0A8D8A1P3_CULPI